MREVTNDTEQSSTIRYSLKPSIAAAILTVAIAQPRGAPLTVTFRAMDTGTTFTSSQWVPLYEADADSAKTQIRRDVLLTTVSPSDTQTVTGNLVITPPDLADTEADPWDAIAALIGVVEAPPDWAAEHDHYLYNLPKRSAEHSV